MTRVMMRTGQELKVQVMDPVLYDEEHKNQCLLGHR
jgi:hypothetical protein